MTRTNILLVALLSTATAADAQGIVRKFLRDTITISDESGQFVEKRPKWPLPPRGAPITGYNAKGQPGIVDDGRTLYLRTSEIETDGMPEVCKKSATTSRASGEVVAGSEGIGSGMSGSGAACIPAAQ